MHKQKQPHTYTQGVCKVNTKQWWVRHWLLSEAIIQHDGLSVSAVYLLEQRTHTHTHANSHTPVVSALWHEDEHQPAPYSQNKPHMSLTALWLGKLTESWSHVIVKEGQLFVFKVDTDRTYFRQMLPTADISSHKFDVSKHKTNKVGKASKKAFSNSKTLNGNPNYFICKASDSQQRKFMFIDQYITFGEGVFLFWLWYLLVQNDTSLFGALSKIWLIPLPTSADFADCCLLVIRTSTVN